MVDPIRDRLYVAVTDRDHVAVVDLEQLELLRKLPVGRPATPTGSRPVNVEISPRGETLYVANAGEDAVVGIALSARGRGVNFDAKRPYPLARNRKKVHLYNKKIKRARKARKRAEGTDREQAARRKFLKRKERLQQKFLRGSLVFACDGPTFDLEKSYARSVLKLDREKLQRLRKARKIEDKSRRRKRKDQIRARYLREGQELRDRLTDLDDCKIEGAIEGLQQFETIGRMPTASYPVDVEVTPDGEQLIWLAARGVGTGANPDDRSIKVLLIGRAGVADRPTDEELRAFTPRADAAIIPGNAQQPPPGTPVVGPGGGPSEQIKYVFYVVRENRTYDQIFGSNPRGEGDPGLQVFDDNGVPGPTGGVTPNAHELSRRFSLMDRVFANTEESTAGHKVTAGGYANDYLFRREFTNRGRKGDPDIFPIGIPPNAYIFDQAVREGVDQRIYGELGAHNQPFGDDGRDTYEAVLSDTDNVYPSQLQGTCRPAVPFPDGTPNSVRCTADSGTLGSTAGPPTAQSRFNSFAAQFREQLVSDTVPTFNYLILFNDHTDGRTPGVYTPRANVADNDLALGQVVELISQSDIWDESAIFVVEDDSQDGADSVDAHRIPAFVISPWAKSGGQVISNRYDQYSFLRTIELILGLGPLSINDALATPLYDAFISGEEQPDVEGSRYAAIQPEISLTETNPEGGANVALRRRRRRRGDLRASRSGRGRGGGRGAGLRRR
ncbi:MAG: bifunctional YncE family protein/alkaline phosphatase family protein [Solirubrobacterales bacterium]